MSNPFSHLTLAAVQAHNNRVAEARNKLRQPVVETAVSLLAEAKAREQKKKTTQMLAANAKAGSCLEQKFLRLWTAAGGPALEREVKFHPTRKWRLDFAHVPTMTAFELQGGNWTNGAHNRGGGMERDCEKSLAAWHLGWSVIPLTPNLVNAETVENLVRAVNSRSNKTA